MARGHRADIGYPFARALADSENAIVRAKVGEYRNLRELRTSRGRAEPTLPRRIVFRSSFQYPRAAKRRQAPRARVIPSPPQPGLLSSRFAPLPPRASSLRPSDPPPPTSNYLSSLYPRRTAARGIDSKPGLADLSRP